MKFNIFLALTAFTIAACKPVAPQTLPKSTEPTTAQRAATTPTPDKPTETLTPPNPETVKQDILGSWREVGFAGEVIAFDDQGCVSTWGCINRSMDPNKPAPPELFYVKANRDGQIKYRIDLTSNVHLLQTFPDPKQIPAANNAKNTYEVIAVRGTPSRISFLSLHGEDLDSTPKQYKILSLVGDDLILVRRLTKGTDLEQHFVRLSKKPDYFYTDWAKSDKP